ncbi:hypothetical protein C5L31_000508 [Secundilactobacillus malefermentans]|uniref:Uncharacterized protein n=1 Tax=Secundilactobacillus malefermentans TaxID=176292 RepID=A0A4R5NQ70_9LACO|nr:hypothetical protein C5L31_000508 [Secundilactobacillus malefermentans]
MGSFLKFKSFFSEKDGGHDSKVTNTENTDHSDKK